MQLIKLFLELRIFFLIFPGEHFPYPSPKVLTVSSSGWWAGADLCCACPEPLHLLLSKQYKRGSQRLLVTGGMEFCLPAPDIWSVFFSGEGTVFVYPNLDIGRAGCWNPSMNICYLLLLVLGDQLPTPFLLRLLLITGISACCFRREHSGGPSSAGLLSCSQLHVCRSRGFWISGVYLAAYCCSIDSNLRQRGPPLACPLWRPSSMWTWFRCLKSPLLGCTILDHKRAAVHSHSINLLELI